MTSALLQLPLAMPRHEKERRIAAIIEQLVWDNLPTLIPAHAFCSRRNPAAPVWGILRWTLCCIGVCASRGGSQLVCMCPRQAHA